MPTKPQPEKREVLEGVSRVALRALTELVGPHDGPGAVRKPLESYLVPMFDAAISPDPKALMEVLKTMRKALITVPQIAEIYVPLVAQRLGDAWCADRLDFAKVTIGSARLQGALRRFDAEWEMRSHLQGLTKPGILVGVPEGEQHTLGACVLAGQLRHRGLSVHLDLELTPEALARELGLNSFSAVLISATGAEHLETLCTLVAWSKRTSRNTPVLIGGSILHNSPDLLALTQADFATCDLREALAFCGADLEVSRAHRRIGGARLSEAVQHASVKVPQHENEGLAP